jgi:hypothetical protein
LLEIHVGRHFFRISYWLQLFGYGLFQLVTKYRNMLLLYASTTLTMHQEDLLDAGGNHVV